MYVAADTSNLKVCVRVMGEAPGRPCAMASVRVSEGVTICGIRIYSSRGRLSVVYPYLREGKKQMPAVVISGPVKLKLTDLILEAYEYERMREVHMARELTDGAVCKTFMFAPKS